MKIGQAIWAKINFKQGMIAKYNRPYLIVKVHSDSVIDILDVSTTKGKEHKLVYSSNFHLSNYDPPFPRDSFVKIDSLRTINLLDIEYELLKNGECLCDQDMKSISNKLELAS